MTLPKFAVDEIKVALETNPVKRLENQDALEAGMVGYCVRCGSEFLLKKPALRVCPRCSFSLHHGVFYVLTEQNHHKFTDGHYAMIAKNK